jgi:hypothetical protein
MALFPTITRILVALKCLGYDIHKLAAYQSLLNTEMSQLNKEIKNQLGDPLTMLNYVINDTNDLRQTIQEQLSALSANSSSGFPRPFPMNEPSRISSTGSRLRSHYSGLGGWLGL